MIIARPIFASLAALGLAFPAAGETPRLTSAQVAGILGVNIHVEAPQYRYTDMSLVEPALRYLGVTKLRDGIRPYFGVPKFAPRDAAMTKLAADGFKFDIPMQPFNDIQKASVRAMVSRFPGSVASLEGPNEANRWAQADLASYQKTLYDFGRVEHIPVVNWSLAYVSKKLYASYMQSPDADFANCHIYTGVQPFAAWAAEAEACRMVSPGKPLIVTETGFSTTPEGGTSELAQAKAYLNTLMDAAANSVDTVYAYELFDRFVLQVKPKETYFGLFHADGTRKPAAVALHNLHDFLVAGVKSHQVRDLDFTLSGATSATHHLLLAKRAGLYDLVVWEEPVTWNPTTKKDVTVPAHKLTAFFAGPVSARIFDPMDGYLARPDPGREIAFQVSDHPVILEISTK